jgi:hypothetical protein
MTQPGLGSVQVSRVKAFQDRLRSYQVLVDGLEVGKVKHGGTWRMDMPIGAHTVQLKIDWKRSPSVAIDVQPGATVALECGHVGGVVEAIPQLLNPDRETYLYLRPP